jgi:signal transduction histidine kinase
MGFNGGSIQTPDRLNTVGHLIISTCLAASAGGFAVCCVAGVLRLLQPGRYIFAPYATLSGIMAGMVANSACCDLISDSAAKPLIVGAVAGIFAYAANWVLQRIYRIDDPIEAVAVHAGGGIVGLVFAGLYQPRAQIWPQLFDIAVLITIGFGLSWVAFWLIDLFRVVRIGGRIPVRLKSTAWEEEVGLTFEDPVSRVGVPPVQFHYLPKDLQKGFISMLGLLIAPPVHIARALEENARALIKEMASRFSKDQRSKTALTKLYELSDDLAERIDSIPDLITRLAAEQGERVCLTEIINEITEAYRIRYNGLVEFQFVPPDDPFYAQGDKSLTPEAIRMLVSNAARACIERLEKQGLHFIEPGSGKKKLRVEITLEKEGTSHVLVNIKDKGIGIHPEVRHYLGQPFAGLDRTGRGSGLGLFFAAYITEAFGGQIDCIASRDAISPEESWTHFVMRLQSEEEETQDFVETISDISQRT